MNVPKWVKPLFIFAGLYTGILGILFLTMPIKILRAVKITPPGHIGYVQFPALLLIIFAIMFFNIAKNPIANRKLIFYGILSRCDKTAAFRPRMEAWSGFRSLRSGIFRKPWAFPIHLFWLLRFRDPVCGIARGASLKLSYCAGVLPYWLIGNIPFIWVPFAFFDSAFLIGFLAAVKYLKQDS